MPGSDVAGLRYLLAFLALLAHGGPAGAFDPERDLWLLPVPTDGRAGERGTVDPLAFERISATGNDREPEYASPDELALIGAAAARDRARLEVLLGQGVNPNGRPDVWGKTALVEAVDGGDVEIVRLLLDAGADPDLRAGGYTPLVRAALLGHGRIAGMLLKHGADPDIKSRDGNTPLTAAAAMNRRAVVRVLLASRPDYALTNLEGRTALSVAALEGHEDVVRSLLEAGVDANIRDRNGNTPMVSAGLGDHETILDLLVKFGGATE